MSTVASFSLIKRGPIKKAAKRILAHLSFNLHHTVGTARFAIPIIAGDGVVHFAEHERGLWQILPYLLRKRTGTFVDVGANLGQTLLKVMSCDRDRVYVGFEPNVSLLLLFDPADPA